MSLSYDDHTGAPNVNPEDMEYNNQRQKDETEVLCCKREDMPSHLTAVKSATVHITNGANFGIWLTNPFEWVKRGVCENDPSWKQIIPYIMFITANGGERKILCYSRKRGGEERLEGKLSIGIGGHIERVDEGKTNFDTYGNAVARECKEEITVDAEERIGPYSDTCGGAGAPVAFIYDPSDKVGAVHLGLLHIVRVKSEAVKSNETCVFDPRYETIEELLAKKDRLENWSLAVLNAFTEAMK